MEQAFNDYSYRQQCPSRSSVRYFFVPDNRVASVCLHHRGGIRAVEKKVSTANGRARGLAKVCQWEIGNRSLNKFRITKPPRSSSRGRHPSPTSVALRQFTSTGCVRIEKVDHGESITCYPSRNKHHKFS